MTAIILSGGKATRLGGRDKAFLEIEGIPIIKRQLSLLKEIFSQIIIVTNSLGKYKDFKGVKLAKDIILERGPLGGIYSGLKESSSFYNFVLACDMPFINKPLIRYIIRHKDSYDIMVPKIGRQFHPLFGIYTKNCIPVIEEAFNKDKLNISNIFTKLNCHFLSAEDISRYDENQLCLFNLNTRQDLDEARGMI